MAKQELRGIGISKINRRALGDTMSPDRQILIPKELQSRIKKISATEWIINFLKALGQQTSRRLLGR
jgi:hypothetical protein